MAPRQTPTPELHVRTDDGRSFRFTDAFHIGRHEDCDIQIDDASVSRRHVVIAYGDGAWWVRDLHSRNGLIVDGERVGEAPVGRGLTIRLGEDGPEVTLEVAARASATRSGREPAPYPDDVNRYFAPADDDEPVGERTMMIREEFQRIQQGQRRRYTLLISIAGVVAVLAAGYGYYGYRQVKDQNAVAEDLFYAMKALDVNIANIERMVATSGNPQAQQQVTAALARRQDIERSYDSFRLSARLERRLSDQDRLIMRVTRLFGECELAAPSKYVAEVNAYIQKWRASDRYQKAIELAARNGYTRRITDELLAQHLPPQFFFLALQESNFDPFISGPPTRKGIAKGMWQFIPETAQKYGLKVGPLVDLRRPDPADDRHHWELATAAAARYIKDIYSTDAQASGLLVMASYNWGEDQIVNLLRRMPANPRERNFWKLLEQHRAQIPAETYDYVFYIVSAAVIGENPRLFGFDFDSPLAYLENR